MTISRNMMYIIRIENKHNRPLGNFAYSVKSLNVWKLFDTKHMIFYVSQLIWILKYASLTLVSKIFQYRKPPTDNLQGLYS